MAGFILPKILKTARSAAQGQTDQKGGYLPPFFDINTGNARA